MQYQFLQWRQCLLFLAILAPCILFVACGGPSVVTLTPRTQSNVSSNVFFLAADPASGAFAYEECAGNTGRATIIVPGVKNFPKTITRKIQPNAAACKPLNLIANGRFFFVDGSTVNALDLSTAKVAWTTSITANGLQISGDNLLVVAADGSIRSLRQDNGTEIQRAVLSPMRSLTPDDFPTVIFPDGQQRKVFYSDIANHSLRIVTFDTATLQNVTDAFYPDVLSAGNGLTVASDGSVAVGSTAGCSKGTVKTIEQILPDNTFGWSYNLGACTKLNAIAPTPDGTIVQVSKNNHPYMVALGTDGKKVWENQLAGQVMADSNGQLVFAGLQENNIGVVSILDPKSGALLSHHSDKRWQSIPLLSISINRVYAREIILDKQGFPAGQLLVFAADGLAQPYAPYSG